MPIYTQLENLVPFWKGGVLGFAISCNMFSSGGYGFSGEASWNRHWTVIGAICDALQDAAGPTMVLKISLEKGIPGTDLLHNLSFRGAPWQHFNLFWTDLRPFPWMFNDVVTFCQSSNQLSCQVAHPPDNGFRMFYENKYSAKIQLKTGKRPFRTKKHYNLYQKWIKRMTFASFYDRKMLANVPF